MQSFVVVEVSVRITVFLGAPGSGKGTQAKKLSQNDKFVHLSTGDLLRNAIQEGTRLGKVAKTFMDKGELVPDSTVIGLIQETLSHLKPEQHVILDGFPRTVAQAEALNADKSTQVNEAISFEIPDSILIERLTGRRVCRQCGQPFHMKYIRPKKEGICDLCGGEVVQRSDDNESVVRRRLEVFHSQNKGLVDYYSDKGKLIKINGDQPADSVQNKLMELLK